MICIWDFDGVLCNSLYECAVVSHFAMQVYEGEIPAVSRDHLNDVLESGEIDTLTQALLPYRPYIVDGKDYLYQIEHFVRANRRFASSKEYWEVYGAVVNDEKSRALNTTFYGARRDLQYLLEDRYDTLFSAYDEAVEALRDCTQRLNTYICTARDKAAVLSFLSRATLPFDEAKIYSRDFNGLHDNVGLGKSQQIRRILDANGGLQQEFILIEDQAKAPLELIKTCRGMTVLRAVYGYGDAQEWAKLPADRCQVIQDPAKLREIFAK